MQLLRKAKKGNIALIWLATLLLIFILGVIYLVFTKPYDDMHSKLYSDLPAEYQPTMDKLEMGWKNWPIFMMLTILVGAIILSISQKSGDQYYRL